MNEAPPGEELLKTKVMPPRATAHMVTRERCLRALDAGVGRRLTLVCAGAGFGKSTLLAQWCERAGGARAVAWLSLDEKQDDAVSFWRYVVSALRTELGPDIGASALSALGQADLTDVALTRLVNELTDLDRSAVLVLDDFHRITSPDVVESVAWFAEHGPPGLQIVIATRSDPALLRLHAFRARGELAELRANDLRFTEREAAELLNAPLAHPLPAEAIHEIEAKTGGWPVGLRLACASLASAGDASEAAERFALADAHTADYLIREVLLKQPEALQAFLLGASPLERFSAGLCDAALGINGSGARIAEALRENVFIETVTVSDGWYRFHDLFRAVLLDELERRDPAAKAQVLSRAARWHRDHGDLDGAIVYALDAADHALAEQIILLGWRQWGGEGRAATLLGWFARFPSAYLEDHPRLLLAMAWSYGLCGNHAAAANVWTSIEERKRGRGDEDDPPEGWFASVESGAVIGRAFFPMGDVRLELACGRRALELEPPGSAWWPAACLVLGRALRDAGQGPEAVRWLDEAARTGPAAGQWPFVVSAYAHLALLARESGAIEAFHRYAGIAAIVSLEHGTTDVTGVAAYVHGLSLALKGLEDDARTLFEHGYQVLRRRGQLLELLGALCEYVPFLAERGEGERAGALLAEAKAVLAQCPEPGIWAERVAALAAVSAGRNRPKTTDAADLTQRERAVLRLLASDLSERELSRELFVSFNTLHSHTRSIYRKLGAASRKEALAIARARGILRV